MLTGTLYFRPEGDRRPHLPSFFLILANDFQRIKLRPKLGNAVIAVSNLLGKCSHIGGLETSDRLS